MMKLSFGSIGLAGPVWVALCSIAINSVAQADVQSEKKEVVGRVRVVYADLDLNHQADVRVLLDRIEKAAYRACGGDPRRHWTYDITPQRTKAVFTECREAAITRAISDIDAPALARAHAALSSDESRSARAVGL